MEDKNFSVPAYRQKWILEFIVSHGGAQIRELSEQCGVSEATIRRDLDQLDQEGHLERTHGGAVPRMSTSFEPPDSEKLKWMLGEKRRIAKKAASLVQDGESIFLDSGSTTFFIAQELASHRNLTVITHNTNIAHGISLHPTSTLVVTGGIKREYHSVLIGSMAENVIRDLHVNKAFLGADAVDAARGVYNSNIIELGLKRLILGCGERAVLVTDSSKFARPALVRICGIQDLHTIITDSGITEEQREKLAEQKTNLLLV